MTLFSVRRASVTDADHFARLHAACFQTPWDSPAFARLLSRTGAIGLLAAKGGAANPLAFALFELAADEAEILTFGVHPRHRKAGAGAMLLAHGCAFLTRVSVARVHLEVAGDNAPALALYRAAGFEEAGRRPAYYRRGPGAPPADGLILTCALAPPADR